MAVKQNGSIQFPFQFHGRDFSAKNNMYLQKILEFHEMNRICFITLSKNPSLSPSIQQSQIRSCLCPKFMKCYHYIIHNPLLLTAEFATKVSLNSLLNKNKSDLYLNSNSIRAGNTSITKLSTLKHKKISNPLITCVFLICHIDLNKRKPIKICNNSRNFINNYLSTKNEKELNEFSELHETLKMNLNKMNDLIAINKNKAYLFECKLQIQHTDIDMFHHLNQAVYGKFIENALLEYSKEYYDGKYYIVGITLNFIKEIKIDGFGNGLPFCNVKICSDIIHNSLKREIIGIVEKNNILHAQFKLILVVDKRSKVQNIRSLL